MTGHGQFPNMVAREVYRQFIFSFLDYIIFGIMLVISIAIGVYYGYLRKFRVSAQKLISKIDLFGSHTINGYLFGTRNMHPVPVAMSMFAGYISGIELFGTPAEIYFYGSQYWLILIPIVIMGPIVSFVYLPVFHALEVSTSYQYLSIRFHPAIGTLASVMFVINEIFYLPLLVYGPAISFNQVSGANEYVLSLILLVSCSFYTILGGAKAVITTGAFQATIMIISVIAVLIYGLTHTDGFQEIISKNRNSAKDRFVLFNFSPSLYERNTFWSILIGGLCYWTAFNAVDQSMVQRYMSVSAMREAQCSVAIYICFLVLFISLFCFIGLQMYAFYKDCDPLTAGLIKDENQILTLYIIQALGHIKTSGGVHLAGVVGASLSTLSTSLNSTSAIIYENILKEFFELNTSKAKTLIKIIVVVLTAITFALVFFVRKLGNISSTLTAISSISESTTFGIFTMGMLIPWSNTRGALIGGFAGCCMSAWIAFGSHITGSYNVLPSFKLPDEVSGCADNLTITIIPEPDPTGIFELYRISDFWICPIGIVTVIIVGTITSFMGGPTNPKTLNRNLISPVLHRWLPVHQSSV